MHPPAHYHTTHTTPYNCPMKSNHNYHQQHTTLLRWWVPCKKLLIDLLFVCIVDDCLLQNLEDGAHAST